MRTLIVHLVCLGLLATLAQAQPVIEFYFSKMSCAEADPYSYALPPEYGSPDLVWPSPGEMVYLWCRTPYGTPWDNIAIDFTPPDVTGGWMHDEVPVISGKGTTDRWENGSDFDPTDEDINLIRGTAVGIGANWNDAYSIPEPGWDMVHYCLGSLCADYTETLAWMSVGSGLITRSGYDTSEVYFGFDEFGNPELAGSGFVSGTTSTRADVWLYAPAEPASLVLLVIAGLALRRR